MRRTEPLRRLIRENRVTTDDLILPLFVVPGNGVRREVASMPGVFQTSIDGLVRDAAEAAQLGIPAVLLFGVPEHKDERGSEGYADDGIVPSAVRALREDVPGLAIITDVCLCEYTTHGHCGVITPTPRDVRAHPTRHSSRGDPGRAGTPASTPRDVRRAGTPVDGQVDNDRTLELLARQALAHARAGADVVAPSDMMDGRVAAIRQTLDDEGLGGVAILSYAAKFASAFYGPFRDAAGSAPQFGDRRGYQMDPPNAEEALREVLLDIEEGADIVMVKPALAYLDVVWRVKEATGYPVCAYHVSGEYAAIQAAGRLGWLDADRAMEEALVSIKRAGADMIVSYWAREFARSAAAS